MKLLAATVFLGLGAASVLGYEASQNDEYGAHIVGYFSKEKVRATIDTPAILIGIDCLSHTNLVLVLVHENNRDRQRATSWPVSSPFPSIKRCFRACMRE